MTVSIGLWSVCGLCNYTKCNLNDGAMRNSYLPIRMCILILYTGIGSASLCLYTYTVVKAKSLCVPMASAPEEHCQPFREEKCNSPGS